MPRFNATRTRQRNAAAVQRAKARQVDEFRRDFEALTDHHRQQILKLRQTLDELVECNITLSQALDALERENRRLRRRFGPVQGAVEKGARLYFVFPGASDIDH